MWTGVAVHAANLRLLCLDPVTTCDTALARVISDHFINSHDPSQQRWVLSAAFIDARDWFKGGRGVIIMAPQNFAFPVEAEKTGVEEWPSMG